MSLPPSDSSRDTPHHEPSLNSHRSWFLLHGIGAKGTTTLLALLGISGAERVALALTAIETLEEREMPTFLMLTNLTAEGVRTLKNHPGRIAEVNREVEQMGVKVVSQYATLGQYDFVTVVEAPDEKTMAKVSVELGSRGTMTSQTLAALPAEDLSSSL